VIKKTTDHAGRKTTMKTIKIFLMTSEGYDPFHAYWQVGEQK